jgi:cation:H+ antiporter
MIFDIAILIAALLIILAGAELFTNGIEWFGRKLELAEGAVGSVLAAVGTALPETLIPLIAILFVQSDASDQVGVGAILGAPFMLSTLAMFVSGVAILVMARRRTTGERVLANAHVLALDLRYFAVAYAAAICAAFVPLGFEPVRWLVALFLLATYAWYVKAHFEADPDVDATDLAALRFHGIDRRAHRENPAVPRLRIVNVQVLVALGFIIAGAWAFVGAVESLATSLGLAPTLLALVIAPIATELPEKANSVLWIRKGKDTLALGNITGAMVFQSTIPTTIGILFAGPAWAVTADSILAFGSAGIAFLSTAAIFVPGAASGFLTGRRLLVGGAFYAVYLGLVGLRLIGAV